MSLHTTDRLARLESTYDALKDDLRHLATTIDRLSDHVSTVGRPNWSLLIGGAALSFTIASGIASVAGIVGTLAISNVNQRTADNKETITRNTGRLDRLEGSVGDLWSTMNALHGDTAPFRKPPPR